MNSYNKGRISHSYLIETNNVSYGYSLAVDLAKFLLCNGVYDKRICDLVDSGNFNGFKVIGGVSDVKKDDLSLLKEDFSLISLDGERRVYIIRDVDALNKYSANSLLKFLEEPNSDIIAILLCNNVSSVMETIVSRCQIVRLINDDDTYSSIFSVLYEKSDGSISYPDFVSLRGREFFEFYSIFEDKGSSVLATLGFYDLGKSLREFLLFGLYMYFDVFNIMISHKGRVLPDDFNFDKILENNSLNDIIKKIDIVNKFIYDSKYNVNTNLFLDNYIISLGGEVL